MVDLVWTRGKCIGKGSYGQVFIANPINSILPQMAVKSAPVDKASSLITEYQILSKFRGVPGIIQCIGDGISHDLPDGKTYDLLLEFAAGGSLSDMIKSGIPESYVRIFTQTLLEALFSIHSKGYTHCDIKPDNVLVFPGSKGHLKIADFGLAMETWNLDPKSSNLKGTLRYLPPEVVVYGKVSPAMDVWALGCTVVEMLTGKMPFDGVKDDVEAMREIWNGGQPEIPKWLSEEGKDFLRWCFMRSPKFRPPAHMLLLHPFITGGHSLEMRRKTVQVQQLKNQMFQHNADLLC
ncbi:Mitogen-activated protein kinase kinase kinase 20 [Linum perenne]